MIGDVSEPVIAFQVWLISPTCGLPSMPQAIAVRIGGTKNGSVISTSSTPRCGVSVRAMIQASRIAVRSEGIVLAMEMPIVLSSTTTLCAVRICR